MVLLTWSTEMTLSGGWSPSGFCWAVTVSADAVTEAAVSMEASAVPVTSLSAIETPASMSPPP